MIVHYGPPDISSLERKLKKLGSFHIPSVREMCAMEVLHEEYRETGRNNGKRATELFRLLNIPKGQDIGTLNDSRYLEKGLDGTHETFKLSSEGIRYMDYFYALWLRGYEDSGGAIKSGYMENPDKRERARQKAKERLAEIVNGIVHAPVAHQNISGVFFEVGGDMRNDGTILTDKNAIVGVNVRGNYTSKKGKIIQGEHKPARFWERTEFQTLGIVIAFLALVWAVYTYFVPNQAPVVTGAENDRAISEIRSEKLATSTLNIADLFEKALKLETVLERQNFLEKYIGEKVTGNGIVDEVSKSGLSRYFVDIRISGRTLVVCPIEKTTENEKRILLLKGKKVDFSGIFTYQQIFGHEGLEIGECSLPNL